MGVRNACRGPGRVNGRFSRPSFALRQRLRQVRSGVCLPSGLLAKIITQVKKPRTGTERWLFRTTKETYRKPSPTAYTGMHAAIALDSTTITEDYIK